MVEFAQDAELRAIVNHASALSFPAGITRAVLAELGFPVLGGVYGASRGRCHARQSIARKASEDDTVDYILWLVKIQQVLSA